MQSCSIEKRHYRDGYYWNVGSEVRAVNKQFPQGEILVITMNVREIAQRLICDTSCAADTLPGCSVEVEVTVSEDCFVNETQTEIVAPLEESVMQPSIEEPTKMDEWKFAGLAILVAAGGIFGVFLLVDVPVAMMIVAILAIAWVGILWGLSIYSHFKYRKTNKVEPAISPFRFLARIFLYVVALLGAYFVWVLSTIFR